MTTFRDPKTGNRYCVKFVDNGPSVTPHWFVVYLRPRQRKWSRATNYAGPYDRRREGEEWLKHEAKEQGWERHWMS